MHTINYKNLKSHHSEKYSGRKEFGLPKHTGWKGYFPPPSVKRSDANTQRCTQQTHNKDAKMSTENQGETNNLRAIYFEHTLSSKQICNNEHTNESIIKALNWSISFEDVSPENI